MQTAGFIVESAKRFFPVRRIHLMVEIRTSQLYGCLNHAEPYLPGTIALFRVTTPAELSPYLITWSFEPSDQSDKRTTVLI